MNLIRYLKLVYWELSKRDSRFSYINAIISDAPGEFGMELRANVVPKYFAKAGKNTIIFPGVRYRSVQRIEVGDNVAIGEGNFLQAMGGLKIGDYSMLGPGVKIWTTNHKFDDLEMPISEQGYETKEVIIGKNVWIAANAFIMPGVELPDGCIVSAGSVVGVKKYLPYSIIAGNPARVVGNRKDRKPEPSSTGAPE